jgi:Pentapeptide repeats (8 copies)
MDASEFLSLYAEGERNFFKENLIGVDLSGKDLSGNNLILVQANLRKANLSKANLSGVNLRFADLTECDLRGANLNGAELDQAIFSKIVYDDQTVFPDGFEIPKDAQYVNDDEVKHKNPSLIAQLNQTIKLVKNLQFALMGVSLCLVILLVLFGWLNYQSGGKLAESETGLEKTKKQLQEKETGLEKTKKQLQEKETELEDTKKQLKEKEPRPPYLRP